MSDSTPETPASGNQIKKVGYTLYLNIPENRLECRCSYHPNPEGQMLTPDEFNRFLEQYSVIEGVDRQAFDDFCLKAAAGIKQSDVLIASGTPPVDGADEYIELLVHNSAEIATGDESVTDVDMHIVQSFINVYSGEEIARIIPPGVGTAGRNILGQSVPPQPGKPLAVKIGKNIRTEEDGRLLIAAVEGRLCQVSGEISVDQTYVVKGDVNFRVGSINFIGVVQISGDVLDNFNVTATKGISVTGNIGMSNLTSDGDISFCGMDGQGKGQIICGGNIHAHFIHDCHVECAGDVIVDVEIHNSTVKALGRVIVDKGAISGGRCIAKGGIEAKKLGSASSQHTHLHAGVDYRSQERINQLLSDLAQLHEKGRLCTSPQELEEIKNRSAYMTEELMDLRQSSDEKSNAKVNVKAVLYENVEITVGAASEKVSEQKNSAYSIIENSIEGGVRYLSMTGLNVAAANIEKAFVAEDEKQKKRQWQP